ncbi:MAG: hypothetical protein ACKVHU_17950 [Acidimicrobiales bacterium]
MSETHRQTREVTLPGTPAEAAQTISGRMTSAGGSIEDSSDAAVSAKFGSQLKFRLVGGFFCPTSWFPVKAEATFTADGEQTKVELAVEEAMGFGLKAGMKKSTPRQSKNA